MKDDKIHKLICSHCDAVEVFDSVPMEWRCNTCDYINGYSNKKLMDRTYDEAMERVNAHQTNDAGEKLQSTEETLKERGNRYGEFSNHAQLSQKFKTIFDDHVQDHGRPRDFEPFISEAIEMIFHKLARIANGDPTYDDNYRDIAGFAELVVKELNAPKV